MSTATDRMITLAMTGMARAAIAAAVGASVGVVRTVILAHPTSRH